MSESKLTAPWWKTGVIYQIYPRSFQDSDGNGIGDLAGIIQRLDYLVWLGVDAIWLSPIYKSPMADFGYDVSSYVDIDPIFGNMDDFDRLVQEAHRRGLKLIMDFVPNHTSHLHPWFLESRSSRDNPKRDWYIWADPGENGGPPNNWLGYFGGPAWTLDQKTGQYYLHNFLPEQPDLNYRNPAVKEAVWNDMRFWLDRGVDGFRIDVVDRMLKDPNLRDNPPNPHYVQFRDNPVNAFERVYSERYEGIHELIQEFQQVIKSYDGRVSIGEIQYYADPESMVVYYGDYESHELDLPFNFGLILQPWQAKSIREFVIAYDAAVPPYGWPNYVLGNHDQHRLATRVGSLDQARIAAMLLLTLRGTPFIYQGDELGMENVDIPPHLVQDPQGKNLPGYTRDVARTPMHWSDEPNAGFTTGTPWLPLADNYKTFNVETERANPRSILNLYQRLLSYRRITPALMLGSFHALDDQPDDCFLYVREYENTSRLIALNFANAPQTLHLEGLAKDNTGRVVLSTYLDREENADLRSLHLRPNEGIIVEL
ncbi:MAG: alpha-amylase family glycosyl hydrolase [Chloroflexota bacterium]|nr:MAG: alpha-amylase [Chloroflexota bacterium]